MPKRCATSAVLLLVLATACTTVPTVDTAADVEAVRSRYADWVAAENRRDVEAAVSFLAPDAIIQGEGAPEMTGHDAAREVWQGFFAIPYSSLEDVAPRKVVVAASGDLAYDIGSWRLILPSDSGTTEERGKSAIVWQKRDGVWSAVAITFSSDAPPPATTPTGN
jgi:uncharacterized protein (TIGR02246 family)